MSALGVVGDLSVGFQSAPLRDRSVLDLGLSKASFDAECLVR